MGKEYKYNKQCRYCGKELTSETTSKNFINDRNYICFDCASRRMSSGGYRIRNLEQVYDPNRNKIHNEIHRKAQLHTNQTEVREEEVLKSFIPKERKYPNPKGRSIIVRHMEVVCRDCDTVLTTTNAYPEQVRNGMYFCKKCLCINREELNNDPLYKEKKEIKSILHKLYARRRLKQFTWKYVEQRFVKPVELTVPQIDKEEYDKTLKLFGEAYVTKRFKPKYSFSLQMSFGDISSREGCKKLLSLFEYELYKSRHAGKRKRERHEAIQYIKAFDPAFRTMTYDQIELKKHNSSSDEDCYVHDPLYEEAYEKTTYKPKIWDPYESEAT